MQKSINKRAENKAKEKIIFKNTKNTTSKQRSELDSTKALLWLKMYKNI